MLRCRHSLALLGLAPLLVGAKSLTPSAQARLELASGVAPPSPSLPSEPSLSAEFVPELRLNATFGRSTYGLRYWPRFYWRYAKSLKESAPLVLERADAAYQVTLSRQATFGATLNASQGQLDYSGADLAFEQPATTPINRSTFGYRSLGGALQLGVKTSTRDQWTWRFGAAYGGPYTIASDASDTASTSRLLEDSLNTSVSLGYSRVLSPRTTLNLQPTLAATWFDERGGFATLSLPAVWMHQLSRITSLSLTAGVMHSRPLGEDRIQNEVGDPATQRRSTSSTVPTGGVTLQSVLYSHAANVLTLNLAAATTGFVDPVVRTFRPVVNFDSGLVLSLRSKWQLSATTRFSTALTRVTSVDDNASVSRNSEATAATATLGAAYPLANWAAVDFGVQTSTRGPYLADAWYFDQEQAVAYLALTLTTSSRERSTD